MKVLIMGYGSVGKVLSKLLLKEKSIKRIICCDLNIKEKKHGKIIFKKVDASQKKNLLDILKIEKPDILVNVLIPHFNTILLECCLTSKVNYIDTASYWNFDTNQNSQSPYLVEQLNYNEGFKKNKIIGLINSGASPGLTNLLAREVSEKLNEIDSIKIRLVEDTRSDKLYFPWSVEWLLDEMNWEPLVYRKGKFKLAKRFSEEEDFNFFEPFGVKRTVLVGQEEIGTIPLYIKLKNADIKLYDSQSEIAKFLFKLGLISDDEIKIDNVEINPKVFLSKLLEKDNKHIPDKWEIKNAQFGLAVIGEGKKNNKKNRLVYSVAFPKEKDIDKLNLGANFISYPTALMLKLFILGISKIKKFGVFPPEGLDRKIREEILESLKKEMIKIKFQTI